MVEFLVRGIRGFNKPFAGMTVISRAPAREVIRTKLPWVSAVEKMVDGKSLGACKSLALLSSNSKVGQGNFPLESGLSKGFVVYMYGFGKKGKSFQKPLDMSVCMDQFVER